MMRATLPPTHHPLPSPPLPLPAPPAPLPLPSTTHSKDISVADMPTRKRLMLTAPTHRRGIRESSATVAARHPRTLQMYWPERDTDRSRNGDNSHDSGNGIRRQVKGTDVLSYNQCFQELALMYERMFPEEFDEAGNGNDVARAYAVGNVGKNLNANVVTGTFFLNNRYASILFDTGAKRSFVSTACRSLIDIVPSTLDHDYDVELVDEKIIRVNTIIRGCTLNYLIHPFNIDLMPVELSSFDIIIGMDWLSMYHAIIVYTEKIVHIPYENETLIVHGDGSDNRHESQLNIISCTKTQKYLIKGCHVFLAHITKKKAKDKSEEKRLKDVPIVQDFPDVFLEDFLGIPPTRQVEFQIDLIPGAVPVA
nr:putative reverse transcriptase domain-containing protein [Tanacetum cinerariifolium]